MAPDPKIENDIQSLLRERAGYVLRDLPDRVAAVDAELARLGHVTAADTSPTERAVSAGPRSASRGRKPKQ